MTTDRIEILDEICPIDSVWRFGLPFLELVRRQHHVQFAVVGGRTVLSDCIPRERAE